MDLWIFIFMVIFFSLFFHVLIYQYSKEIVSWASAFNFLIMLKSLDWPCQLLWIMKFSSKISNIDKHVLLEHLSFSMCHNLVTGRWTCVTPSVPFIFLCFENCWSLTVKITLVVSMLDPVNNVQNFRTGSKSLGMVCKKEDCGWSSSRVEIPTRRV